ncbi:Cytosolic Fe-S cluster assembly factor narfl [Echinococcus granulosus]|uniref:Cytosolic Fe S cluster assembly factor NARFL n=1 Tax=Echinococcus granulosus TaxID=6210 RepID=A0A068WVI4_ECHGR|nr:Cytosolic Fe-S cluster assembly factor narfl [Echinococcus granulosus]CDS21645.1 cytosolic Fe S cluster assembly factor NARFL [Echinococcus granulosus]
MHFSAALKIADVDDYISPSLECIKPVKIPRSVDETKSITIGEDGTYVATNESGEKYTLAKAKIDLNDCLSCSGCITTAETVLVSQHSVDTFLNLLKEREKYEVVVALSPQSLASLTASLQRGSESSFPQRVREAFAKVSEESGTTMSNVRTFCARLLHSHGAVSRPFLDTTWSRDVTLAVTAKEFVSAFADHSDAPKLPILTGICPGWVCYAEKTHFKVPSKSTSGDVGGDSNREEPFLLQHISRVRSPQQLLAGVLKRAAGGTSDSERRLFLVFVMPCYDKKLEASRSQFLLYSGDGVTTKEADLVLGTNEFVTVLDAILQKPTTLPVDTRSEDNPLDQRLSQLLGREWKEEAEEKDGGSCTYRHAGSGSGGYAFAVLRHAAEQLFHIHLPPVVTEDPRVLTRHLGNHDLQEILLFNSVEECEAADRSAPAGRTPYRHAGAMPTPLLAFLVANGFRNIQTVVQQLKRAHIKAHSRCSTVRAEAPFDFVEIMACPSGCLNGGAQLKTDLPDVSQVYFSLEQQDILQSEISKQLHASLDPISKQRVCYTTYKAVPKVEITNPSVLKW